MAVCQKSSNKWDRKEKRHIEVQRPSIVGEYNRHMGGIDLLDFLMSRYKITMKSKKWVIKLFFSFCDMIMVMSWLLYKRNVTTAFGSEFKTMDLLQFRSAAAEALCKTGEDPFQRRSPGRPAAKDWSCTKRSETRVTNQMWQSAQIALGTGPNILCKRGNVLVALRRQGKSSRV